MLPRFASRPLYVILSGALVGSAVAEPVITLDTVAVTASRVEHNTFDLPAAIDVVDAARIGADQSRVNASEALAAVPGVTVQNRQNYAQDLQISSRGFGARSAFGVRGIRLVSDGIPVSMPDGQGQAATFNLDRAERLEVMRGPLSAIYGNHAGGVIQLFTADGKGRPSVETNISAGSHGSWKVDLASQGEADGIGYVVDASRFHTDGYRDHSSVTREQQLIKLTARPDADSRLMFVANGFRQMGAQDPLGLTWAQYRADRKSVDPAALTFNTRKSIEHAQGGLSYERRFGEDLLQVSTYIGRRSVIQYQSIPIFVQRFTADPATFIRRQHSGGVIDFDRDFSGVGIRWIMRREFAGGKLTTTFGVEHETASDERMGFENYLTTSLAPACGTPGTVCGVKGNLRRRETDTVTNTDPYIQTEWQGDKWAFSAGLRHTSIRFKVNDDYVALGNADDSGKVSYREATPVLAAVYKATPGLNFYASAARGFEAPTLNELFYSGANQGFSFDLKPATSRHLELGMKAFVGEQSRLDLALFEVRTEDELVVAASAGGRTSYRNAGETLRQGLELALGSQWYGGFSSRLAYSHLRAVYDKAFTGNNGTVESGRKLPGVAANTFFGELAWRHAASGFHAAVELIAKDKVYVEDTNARKSAPGFGIANLRLGIERKFGSLSLNTFLRLDNLFDRDYIGSVIVGDSNGRYYESAPGRNWLLGAGARYTF